MAMNIGKDPFKNNQYWRSCGTNYSRMDQVKFFKCCLPQISLGPFLNTLSHVSQIKQVLRWSMITQMSSFTLQLRYMLCLISMKLLAAVLPDVVKYLLFFYEIFYLNRCFIECNFESVILSRHHTLPLFSRVYPDNINIGQAKNNLPSKSSNSVLIYQKDFFKLEFLFQHK